MDAQRKMGALYWGCALALLAAMLALPAQAPVAASTPDPLVQGWAGEYYDNRLLSGSPRLVRDDAAVSFEWGYGSPAPGLPADGFSARWTRSIYFPAGTYRFHAFSDDGVRVWLNGDLIIDEWHPAPGLTYVAERTLAAGTHSIRIEYYEEAGWARMHFGWEAPAADYFPQWKGEYYANGNFSGSPVLVRNDAKIDFDWGTTSPAGGVPADDFSARWTRQMRFYGVLYRFYVVVDGKVKLWVNGQLIIDAWSDDRTSQFTSDRRLEGGDYEVKVEYSEGRGEAEVRVWWERVYVNYHPAPGFPNWRGQYFNNPYLAGHPKMVRNDTEINFNWGSGSPGPGLPVDRFSIRWDARIDFAPGRYTFHAQADNDIRVYLDGELILDDMQGRLTAIRRLSGSHHLSVEYEENRGLASVRFWWE